MLVFLAATRCLETIPEASCRIAPAIKAGGVVSTGLIASLSRLALWDSLLCSARRLRYYSVEIML
jgi:hypothetical protein